MNAPKSLTTNIFSLQDKVDNASIIPVIKQKNTTTITSLITLNPHPNANTARPSQSKKKTYTAEYTNWFQTKNFEYHLKQ